jgi:hypothetical protein
MIYVSTVLSLKDREEISKNPYVSAFVIKDVTLSGELVEYGLLVFAVFTLLRGMCEIGLITHDGARQIIMSEFTTKVLYGIVGIILTVFYALVVYTDYITDKDPNNSEKYESVNLVHGLVFLAMIPAFLLFDSFMTLNRYFTIIF